jgi:hypothetical protein
MTPQNDPITSEIEQAKKIFKLRTAVKGVSQVSYEMKEIDKSIPMDYYELNNGKVLLELYDVIADKIIELAVKIQEARQPEV